MRVETPRDLIATWFVADDANTASMFPQTGLNSSERTFQDIYWRCVVCFYATAVRQAPLAKYVFYTNTDRIPIVDGINVANMLAKLGVEVRVLSIEHRLGREKVQTWNNQFYILDIIEDLKARTDFDTVLVLDSDCVWVRQIGSLLRDIDRRGVLSLSIPYSEEFLNNGASRKDLQKAASQLADVAFDFIPHYSGGELFAANATSLISISEHAEKMWKRLADAPAGAIKVHEEGQFLSILYEMLNVPVGSADPHCKRMWTALRLNNVSAEDVYSSRCIWHLPMEKKTGFAELYHVVCDTNSWFWSKSESELFLGIAAIMGIPQRSTRQWLRHIVARARFHLEKRRGLVQRRTN